MRKCFDRLAAILVLVVVVLTCVGATQNSSAQSVLRRATSTPYTGDLSIFDSPGRDQKLHIDRVMEVLDIRRGEGVADIGAGSGWFTVRAARRVGPSGTVYAVDINPEAIHYIDGRVHNESLANVKTILSKPDDPMLPKDAVDSVLLLKTYHEVADPVTLMKNLRAALRPGARIGIIDRTGDGKNHGVNRRVVIEELGRAGYRFIENLRFREARRYGLLHGLCVTLNWSLWSEDVSMPW